MTYSELQSTDTISSDLPEKFNANFLRARRLNAVEKTAAFTVWADDATGSPKDFYFCNATAAAFTVTLPTAAGVAATEGRLVTIMKTDSSNNVTIDADGSETINGATTKVLSTQYASVTLISDGSNWYILSDA